MTNSGISTVGRHLLKLCTEGAVTSRMCM